MKMSSRQFGSRLGFRFALLVFAVIGFATRSEAHLVTTGLGPLYDGMGHLLLSPDEWAAVAALAMLAGLRGREHGRLALFGLPAFWLAGGIIGILGRAPLPATSGAVVLLIAGGCVAADWRLERKSFMAVYATLGALLGYISGLALAPMGGTALALFGSAVVAFVIVALVAAVIVSLQKHWQRIAVRVAGSWIAAIGILMIGWAFRKS